MERRPFLATAGTALSTSLVGCLGTLGNVGRIGGESGTGDGNTGGDRAATEAGTHHLYLVNLDHEAQRVDLAIVERDGAEPVLEGTYEIPGEKGAEFREVAAWDETYDVTAAVRSSTSETFCWEIESCPGPEAEDDEAELPGGSRNGSVRIEPGADDLSFVTDSCDEIIAGTEVPTGPATQFEVEEAN